MTVGQQEPQVRWRIMALVSVCFLLTSTGYLSWVYHLVELVSGSSADTLSMVGGYVLQAVGITVYMRAGHTQSGWRLRHMTLLALLLYVLCLAPATLASNLETTLAFGFLSNLLCGLIAGHYLHVLAIGLAPGHRASAFGTGYAIATLLGWLLSLVQGGMLVRGVPSLLVCATLAAVAAPLLAHGASTPEQADGAPEKRDLPRETILLACSTVVLASVVKNLGYSFPTEDLSTGVNLELSRLFYGIGLVAAGVVGDKNRRYGELCCAAALVMPFLLLALQGASAPGTVLWAVDYLLYGFFSVFRVTLLADLAAEAGKPWMAGAGLMLGRVGDAAGTALCTALTASPLVLVTTTALLFAGTIALFFLLDQQVFAVMPVRELSERERFDRFAAHHDLSPREREVLRLMLAERSNAEIASELFVSEATVKFHVRNVLKKTGCRTRVEVMASYAQGV